MSSSDETLMPQADGASLGQSEFNAKAMTDDFIVERLCRLVSRASKPDVSVRTLDELIEVKSEIKCRLALAGNAESVMQTNAALVNRLVESDLVIP